MWWCIPSLTTLPLLARYPLHERRSNNRLSASGFGVSFICSLFSFCQKRLVNEAAHVGKGTPKTGMLCLPLMGNSDT